MFYTLTYHQSEESKTGQELGNLSPYKEAPILTATLFTIGKHCNQPCPSADEWIMKMGVHIKEHHPSLKYKMKS